MNHHLLHALALFLHHLHRQLEHLQVLCALLSVLLGKVSREFFEDLISRLHELLCLQKLHVSMRDLREQFLKLFGIVAVNDDILPRNVYLPPFFVSGKFPCDEIIARLFYIGVRDYEEYVPRVEVLEKFADSFNCDRLLKVHAIVLSLNDDERGINLVAPNGDLYIGNYFCERELDVSDTWCIIDLKQRVRAMSECRTFEGLDFLSLPRCCCLRVHEMAWFSSQSVQYSALT